MLIELCRVRTVDGLLLTGSLQLPAVPPSPTVKADAVLLIHGTGSNFYSGGLLERLSEQLVQAGLAVLRINTRGHDLAATIPAERGSVRGGAAFESIDDAPRDVAAWLKLLSERGFRKVLIAGHSMGGVKAFLSVASPDVVDSGLLDSVAGVIGISPPRFCHANLTNHPGSEPFRRDYDLASRLVREGAGETLIDVTQPLPLVITAAGFCRKYGPDDPYDYLKVLPRLRRPVLIIIGTESLEQSPAFSGSADAIAARQLDTVRVEIVEGANVVYSKCPDEPFRRIEAWLSTLV